MSHFTTLVIGENPEKQLAPFEERLKIEWHDLTDEYREEYETKSVSTFYCGSHSSWGMQITKELFDFIKSKPEGAMKKMTVDKATLGMMSYYKNNEYYRGYYALEDGKRCEGDAWFQVVAVNETTHPDDDVCFEGVVTIRVIEPPKQIALKDKYPDYNDYLEDWHGAKPGEKCGYYTNPKAKWDWYSIGGRWTGFFKSLNGKGKTGKPGLDTPQAKPGYADQLLKKEVDFAGMRKQKEDEAAELYDKIIAIVGEHEPQVPWSELLKTMFVTEGRDKAIEFYHAQPRLKAFSEYNKANKHEYAGLELDDFIKSREEYITSCGNRAGIPFSVVKDGEWYEKGSMGWWGTVSNEEDQETWNAKVTEMINALPADTLLTLVDCHI